MSRKNLDTEFYAIQIRRLAAMHQSGGGTLKIKKLVDNVIASMEAMLKFEEDVQVMKWSELFKNLDAYMSKFSDPNWMTIILYARRQISQKKSTAKTRYKNAQNAKSAPYSITRHR